jgi:hypothetical protein
MPASSPFAILRQPCDQAINWAASKLEQANFRAVRTFDLQVARMAHLDCPCPHHGTEQCNCQMVVFLVYQNDAPPVTLVIHGNEEMSWLYLIDKPQQPNESPQEKAIQDVLSPEPGSKNN